jgi:hypothetical protein
MHGRNLLRNIHDWLRVALSLAVIAGLLAGCIANIALPTPIMSGTGNAYTPAMALAADGTKHIVWQECPQSGGCSIYYYRTRLGEPLVTQSFAPPVGADNRSPDIALADDGTAYIVWTTFYSTESVLNFDAYAVVHADGSASGVSNLDPNLNHCLICDLTAGGPQVVARGNNVYGLYNVQPEILLAGGTSYRQLNPLDAHTGTVAVVGCDIIDLICHSTVRAPKAILDSAGKLHVAYDRKDCASGVCTDVMYQADNTAADNMSSISLATSSDYLASDGSPFTAPDIAVAGNNSIFVSYSYSQTVTDAVIYATGTTFASPFVTATVPLTGALDAWRVEGNVHVAAVGTGVPDVPVVAFAAKNSTTGSRHEVWLFTQGDSNVTGLTNNNGDQNEPLIAMMGTPSAGVAVVGWRTWHQISFFSCLRDGYEYDQLNLVVQKVFSSTGGCFSTGQALAANANWASAVWIDSMPQHARLVPWLGFNANSTFLPVITR